MARNTKQGSLLTENVVHQTIIDSMLNDGWEHITYGNLAKKVGLTRSGIQRIVPTKEIMIETFEQALLNYVITKIDDSSLEKIKSSWLSSLQDKKFANCIRFYLYSALSDNFQKVQVQKHLDIYYKRYGSDIVKEMLGHSYDYFMSIR